MFKLKNYPRQGTTEDRFFENQEEEYWTVKDIAQKYAISERTVRGWIYKGKITPRRIGPKLIKFKKSEFERWISQHNGEEHGSS